jgi:hypothetical protein
MSAIGLVLAGCAGQTDSTGSVFPSAAAAGGAPAGARDAASIPPAPSGYKLTPADMKLDCAKLTGQMKVRIANMRAAAASRTGTSPSRALQSVVTPVFGGTQRGANPEADLQLDRAKIDAFNKRLAEKKCKTLDIDAELRS